jgi:hypothetical protein
MGAPQQVARRAVESVSWQASDTSTSSSRSSSTAGTAERWHCLAAHRPRNQVAACRQIGMDSDDARVNARLP